MIVFLGLPLWCWHMTLPAESRDERVVSLASTQCRNGHPRDARNLYIDPQGRRFCRAYQRAGWRKWKRLHRRPAAGKIYAAHSF